MWQLLKMLKLHFLPGGIPGGNFYVRPTDSHRTVDAVRLNRGAKKGQDCILALHRHIA